MKPLALVIIGSALLFLLFPLEKNGQAPVLRSSHQKLRLQHKDSSGSIRSGIPVGTRHLLQKATEDAGLFFMDLPVSIF
jgi:hypothetical protein